MYLIKKIQITKYCIYNCLLLLFFCSLVLFSFLVLINKFYLLPRLRQGGNVASLDLVQ